MPEVKQETIAQYSNGTYTSLLKAKLHSRTATTLVIANLHASHNLKWKVLVSDDPEGAANTWAEEKAEATINGAATVAPVKHVISGPFCWVDVQIMSAGPAESPQASAWLLAVGL
jgi:hypothetical protein